MDNKLKTALLALLAAIIGVFMYYQGMLSGTPDPVPSPTPTISAVPSPVPSAIPSSAPSAVKILDTFERPEFVTDAAKWKPSVTRTILKGQTTGFVGMADLCKLVGTPGVQQMAPIVTKYPSAKGYRVGTYYDAIQPLTAANCGASPYFYFEGAAGKYPIGDALITVVEKTRAAPALPTIPFMILSNNYGNILGWCGAYCNAEAKGLAVSALLLNHRLQPYGSTVIGYDGVSANPIGFSRSVLPFSASFTSMPSSGATDITLKAEQTDVAAHPEWKTPWFYVMDEPNATQIPALKTLIDLMKLNAPSIKRMVTTTFRSELDVDIYAPVAEQLGVNGFPGVSAYAGKGLWSYVSCMSHGCGPNRAWQADPKVITHVDYAASGAPDLVLDAAAVNEFGMYILAFKHNLGAVLYYNANEQWALWPKGVDVWVDPYNFGGNGDGTLLYPDRVNQVALPSIRLKLIREASQWADIVTAAGMQTDAAALMKTSLDWTRDMGKIEALRDAAISKL